MGRKSNRLSIKRAAEYLQLTHVEFRGSLLEGWVPVDLHKDFMGSYYIRKRDLDRFLKRPMLPRLVASLISE